MSVTADMVRSLIVDHDNGRARSQQTAVGPSNLSSPCSRQLVYQILNVPPVADRGVNLMAWVGTAVHSQFEALLAGNDDWLTEQRVGVDLGKGLTLAGNLDAYHKPSKTVVDWKTVGPSAMVKYRRASPDNYRTQVAIYGLLAVLSGRMSVENTAIVYVPRNGELRDIHVDCHVWDQDRADAAIKRLEALHVAAQAGEAVLPLIPTADACRFCHWWMPGSDQTEVACTGHPTTDVHGIPPWQPEKFKESASA